MKSVSFDNCNSQNHDPVRHSPDGFNMILECHQCHKAWQIMGATGEVTLLSAAWMDRVVAQENELKDLLKKRKATGGENV